MKKYAKFFFPFVLIIACLSTSVCAVASTPYNHHHTINLSTLENNPDIVVSDVMTYQEIVERYAENEGITFQDALKAFPRPTNATYYRVLSAYFTVTSSYVPHLDFYCVTAEGGNFRNINSIYNVQLVRQDRSNKNLSKQFNGDIQVWLRNHNKIEYVVNGDFYNNGTTTVSVGLSGSVGVGKAGKVSLSASITSSSNHYKYCYAHHTVTYSG